MNMVESQPVRSLHSNVAHLRLCERISIRCTHLSTQWNRFVLPVTDTAHLPVNWTIVYWVLVYRRVCTDNVHSIEEKKTEWLWYRRRRPESRTKNHVVYYVPSVKRRGKSALPVQRLSGGTNYSTIWYRVSKFDYESAEVIGCPSNQLRVAHYLPVQQANTSLVNCKSLYTHKRARVPAHCKRQGHRKSIWLEMHKFWLPKSFFLAQVSLCPVSALPDSRRLSGFHLSKVVDAWTSISLSVNQIDPCRRNGFQ